LHVVVLAIAKVAIIESKHLHFWYRKVFFKHKRRNKKMPKKQLNEQEEIEATFSEELTDEELDNIVGGAGGFSLAASSANVYSANEIIVSKTPLQLCW